MHLLLKILVCRLTTFNLKKSPNLKFSKNNDAMFPPLLTQGLKYL